MQGDIGLLQRLAGRQHRRHCDACNASSPTPVTPSANEWVKTR